MKNYIDRIMPPLLDEEKIFLKQRKTTSAKQTKQSVIVGTTGEYEVASYLLTQGKLLSKPSVDHGIDWMVYHIDNPRKTELAQVKEIYRIDEDSKATKEIGLYAFQFQSGGHLNRRKNNRDSVDVYYATFVTPYRCLIFEIPSTDVPVNERNNLVVAKKTKLDESYSYTGPKPDMCFKDYLVRKWYDDKIVQTYPSFFKEKNTLSQFIES
jgi:hypothetical protein